MHKFAVIGQPIAHSQSPECFTELWAELKNAQLLSYRRIEIAEGQLAHWMASDALQLDGFNVTMPHKRAIMDYLHHVTDSAKAIQAVNTVCRINNQWHGHNSDWEGFWDSIKDAVPAKGTAVLIGNGGAARAVQYALESHQWQVTMQCRKEKPAITCKQTAYGSVHPGPVDLIVNCTPLGMHKLEHQLPQTPVMNQNTSGLAVDLIYIPEKTLWLKQMEEMGWQTRNGQGMLMAQAKKAWGYWKNALNLTDI
jgi:shikimate dehydrogenase